MSDVLFIKTSSLGDVVHNMPAVTDARRHHPAARIAWLVEETYAPLVRLHPAVDDVMTVATRRWRRRWAQHSTLKEIQTTRTRLREIAADTVVVDTQGLVRSALFARWARGVRHGYDFASVRETIAVAAYDVRHRVPKTMHAVERNRLLTAAALDYGVDGIADYGLTRPERDERSASYAVLLHGSAQSRKEWPEANWGRVIDALAAAELRIVLASGNEEERRRSGRLASGTTRSELLHAQPLDRVARTIAGARIVIGVDTGLLHLAAAYGVPLVGIYGGSEPALTGPRGSGPIEVLGTNGDPPESTDAVSAVRRLLA